MSFFTNQQNQSQTTGGLFSNPQSNTGATSLFGANNNNKSTNIFGGNAGNISFGANNNNKPNNIFGGNNPTNISFGASNNSGGNLFTNNTSTSNTGGNNTNNQPNTNNLSGLNSGNQQQNIFGQNNTQNTQNNNNFLGNLSGINSNNNNQNNNNQQNNIFNNPNNQRQNQYLNLKDAAIAFYLKEYEQILLTVKNCYDPSQRENMFKDYLYNPIPKGTQPNDVNVFRGHTYYNDGQQQKGIINDYNIWEAGEKNNPDANKYYPVQISSVDALLKRYKNLEKTLLESIAKTVETQKSLENLNKQIDNEMNNRITELKNCHEKLDKLQISLSAKVAQYNYLLGTAKENINDTQQIKDNLKKANENIKKNNMIELSEKVKKLSNEEMGGENKDYIKELSKEKINYMLDALVEIKNMMNVVNNNNKKNLNIVNGMQKEIDRIMKKNEN